MAAAVTSSDVIRLRSFNRRYTQVLGLLNERVDCSLSSPREARVLYELAHCREQTAAEIARRLRLDPGQLSRILKSFEERGFLIGEVSPEHARHRLLSLSPAGRAAFGELDRQTQTAVGRLLEQFEPHRRTQLVELAGRLETVLAAGKRLSIGRRAPATWAGSAIARRCATPRNTAGTGPTRRWSQRYSASSLKGSTPGAMMLRSQS